MTTSRRTIILLAAAVFASTLSARPPSGLPPPSPTSFPVRMVKLAGDPGRLETVDHVKFCAGLGFNALWVYSQEAGVWSKQRAPQHPILDPAFLRLARWCRRRGIDVWVSINPFADSSGKLVYSDPDAARRILSFISMLEKEAGVRHVVLSFDDQPRTLSELSDVFRYGASAAPAQLDLVSRVAGALPRDVSVWMCASAYTDVHLGDGTGPYAKPFLAGLPSLPAGIGIVWTGPEVTSRSIGKQDLAATRARLGGRRILLYDNFPENGNEKDDAMALILGALRQRDPAIRDEIAAYLACPALPLAGSRLSLMTTAEFLLAPERYDPDAATRRAIERLAGRDPAARDALTTQQLEWGGFIGGHNYWPGDALNPELSAGRLHDPAFVDSFTWTAARYPGRMAALARVGDDAFRDALLRTMRRRLVVARAMPLVVAYTAAVRRGGPDVASTLAKIDAERRSFSHDPDASRTLERFLIAAGIPPPGSAE